jgi:hypothetical protein
MSKNKYPLFVMVTHQVLDSPAWRAMSSGARCLYIALKRRFSPNGRNNGRIYLSQRQARKEVRAGSSEIVRWFRELQYYGFIVMIEPGCLGVEGKGKAPRWRLTEVAYMRGTSSRGMEGMPTMDFLKWDGVRFSRHQTGGDHLKSKTESRSRKPERGAPENRSTRAPENQSTRHNYRSRKPEHMSGRTPPENRSKSIKPSRLGGRVLSAQSPVGRQVAGAAKPNGRNNGAAAPYCRLCDGETGTQIYDGIGHLHPRCLDSWRVDSGQSAAHPEAAK